MLRLKNENQATKLAFQSDSIKHETYLIIISRTFIDRNFLLKLFLLNGHNFLLTQYLFLFLFADFGVQYKWDWKGEAEFSWYTAGHLQSQHTEGLPQRTPQNQWLFFPVRKIFYVFVTWKFHTKAAKNKKSLRYFATLRDKKFHVIDKKNINLCVSLRLYATKVLSANHLVNWKEISWIWIF